MTHFLLLFILGFLLVNRVAYAASVAFDETGYLSLDTVTITVTDTPMNLNGAVREVVTCTVVSPFIGDTELIHLTETGETTGIFTNSVVSTNGQGRPLDISDTASIVTFNNILTVRPGRTILAIYFSSSNTSTSTDTKPVTFLAVYAGPKWYVNDTSTIGDSFSTATGEDSASLADGSLSYPFRTIQKTIQMANAGDTIYIDAGTYTETTVVDTEMLSLVGADSRTVTIDPPGASGTVGLVGILIQNCTNVLIKNIGVTGAYDGIQLSNADSCILTSDSIGSCGSDGIELKQGSDFNTLGGNIIFNVSSYGVNIDTGASNTVKNNTLDSNFYGLLCASETNVIRDNTVKNNLNIGVYLNVAGAYGNRIESNTLTGNGTWGVYLAGPENRADGNIIRQNTSGGVYISAASNIVRFNLIQSNTAAGMEITNSSAIVEQNDITGNDTGVFFNASVAGIILRKNNIASNNVNNIRNAYAAAHTADRNFWGTTDEVTITAKFNDANSAFRPYRLAKVDTAAGADTTAPAAPTGVTLDTSVAGRIKISWVIPALNEETNGGTVGFNGVKVWRLKNQVDTTSWANSANLVKTLTATDSFWIDTGVTGGETYYYRLSSKDAATILNESFFTDTKFAAADSALFASVATTVGMTAASGDGNGGAWGDYDNDTDLDMFVVNYGAADFLFKNDGAGSFIEDAVTAGVNGTAGGVGAAWADIDNDGDLDLYVVNNGGANDYMYKNNGAGVFTNVATSVGMTDADNGDGGAWGDYDNDGDLDLYVSNASSAQDFLYRNDGGTFRRVDTTVGMSDGATSYGVAWADYDKDGDLDLFVAHGGTAQDALYKNNGHGQFTNVATSVGMTDAKDGRAAEWGDFDNDGDIDLCVANPGFPYFLYRNDGAGTFTDVATSAGLTDTGHSASGVSWVDYDNDADLDLYFNDANGVQDRLYRNNGNSTFTEEAVHRGITGGGASYGGAWADYDNDGDLDLYVMQSVGNRQDFLYRSRGIAGKNWIKVKPLTDKNGNAEESDGDSDRLAVGAFVEIDLNGGANFDTGFGKYVSALLTSNGFTHTAAPVHVGVETAATVDVRVTFPDGDSVTLTGVSTNQTIQVKDTVSYSGPNWYVNDTTTAGDSFSTGAGSDVTGRGSASKPFRSITKALARAKAGDTIYIDAGTYAETVVIDADTISLIGMDSGATVIDPPGAKTLAGLYGIYADTQAGLAIKNIGVTGAYEGIYFVNVDQSTITGDSASTCGDKGIYLLNGSDTNTVSNNTANFNFNGIYLSSSSNNTVSNNMANSNTAGIYLITSSSNNTVSGNTANGNTDGFDVASSSNNTLSGNTALSNSGYGIYVFSSSTGNTLSGNSANSNGSIGIFINGCSNNTVKNNTVNSNTNYGIELNASAVGNLVVNNLVASNSDRGIYLENTLGNSILQNEIRDNTNYQVTLAGTASSDTLQKNNIVPSGTNPDSAVTNVSVASTKTFTFTRNWFGSADSATVRKRIAQGFGSDSIIYAPFRLAAVDTTAGADTTAPKAPDTVAILGIPSDTSIVLAWSPVTTNEEGVAGSPSLSSYAIYRSEVKDTSSWLSVAVTSATQFQDTDVGIGKVFYYRVTAYDTATPFKNESFYSDSQPSDSAVALGRVNWYVNDATTAGDSFTSLAGSDVTGDGTKQKPFATIAKAFQFAGSGDSVIVDSGVYNLASNLTIGVSNLSLIGVDSASTILDRGDTATSTVYGIYATNLTGLTIKNLRVRKSWHGIYWNNVDYSTIDGVTVSDLGNVGFYNYTNCDYDTFTNNVAYKTNSVGFYFYTSTNNYVKGNTALQTNSGFYMVYSANQNVFINNRAEKISGSYGFWSNQSDTNLFYDNVSFDNISNGFLLDGAQFCVVSHNTIDSNADYQIAMINNGALYPRSNTVEKNNILPSPKFPDSGLINSSSAAGTFAFTRNWWGTSDSAAIKNKIMGVGRDAVVFSPWRLAAIDSAPGADTTAPKAPDTVAVVGAPSDTAITIEWSAVSALEESNGGAVGLSGYRVYRSAVKDTSSWIKVAQLASGVIRWQDTSVTVGQAYYYRVTAFDAAAFENESFFSDSQPSDSAAFTSTVNWYVNDSSTAGDSFTYAGGSDTSGGKGTAGAPFATITRALLFATAGDTVWIDAGSFAETVVINTDSVSLIGKDSASTIIDPPGVITTAGLYSIYATGRTGLTIQDIRVTGGYNGLRFNNVDSSTITRVNSYANAEHGIALIGGSDINTVSNCLSDSNGAIGLGFGIYLSNASQNVITGNVSRSNTNYGIFLEFSPTANNIVSNNTVESNAFGIYLKDGANNNTVSGNTVQGQSAGPGIYIYAGSNNTLTGNRLFSNHRAFNFEAGGGTVANNIVRNNLIKNSISAGVQFAYMTGSGNVIAQNDFIGGDTGIYFQGGFVLPTDITIAKNNFLNQNVKHIFNEQGNPQSFARNWFGSTDSAAIKNKITDTANAWQPYRLGLVDTTAGADTTAPKAPDTVGVVGLPSDTSVILEWTAVTALEESNGGAVGLSGYRVYRSAVKDTSSWVKVAQVGSGAIRYQDTDVLPGQVFYYRVTAFDAAAFPNESFFSDSQPFDSAVLTTRANWYVNDASTAGDSFTYLAGSDVTGEGTAQKPFKSIPRAMYLATAGDTIFIDAGLYDSYMVVSVSETAGVNIDKDSITLIGKDSGATVIDPPGDSNVSGLYGIFADTQVGLTIKNLGVTGAYDGFHLYNVDNSLVQGDSSCANGNNGIYLWTNSDTNIIKGNTTASNNDGIYLYLYSSNNTVSNNTVNSNLSVGIDLLSISNFNLVSNNTLVSNKDGIYLSASSNNNTITNNTIKSNLRYGIGIGANPSGNIFVQNDILLNSLYQISVGASSGDTFQKNNIKAPTSDSGVETSGAFDFTRNWWGTTDSQAIKNLIVGGGASLAKFQPFRLGPVDTAAGADTTAPKAPDTVGVIGAPSDTAITIEWSAVTALEESNGGAVGLSGYRVYRSAVKDTSSWVKVGQTGSGAIRYQDTDVLPGQIFYYRVTAFDAATFPNESFFSDSQLADSAVATSRVSWYVNNNSTTGDSFTFATGSDTSGDGTAQKPYRTISKALGIANTGDTIFIDAGLYAETVVIEANSMALVGKDSNATVIDPPGSNGTAGLNGISAASLTGITIKNLGVTGANRGIFFQNVDLATLTGDSIGATGSDGIRLDSGCDTNMIDRTTIQGNSTNYALHVSGNGNTVRQNLFTGNTSTNIIVTAPALDNLVESNTISGGLYGVWINQSGVTRTRVLGNVITDVTQIGIPLDTTDSNVIRGNLIRNSAVRGINLFSSQGNVIEQNQVDANPAYTIYIDGTSAGNIIQKNNFIITSPSTPDSGVYNNTSKTHDFARNWWGTTDEVTIRNRIAGTGADSVTFRPYRLRQVDTAIGADTTAPAKPTSVTLDTATLAGNIVIMWVNPTINEETNGGTVGNIGIRVFRLRNQVDTTNWANQVNLVHTGTSTETTWTDTDVNLAVTYYYRLSARDGAALTNDAFFTDTKFAASSLAANVSGRWYVNDGYTAADSFTTIGGSDTAGNGTAANPYRTITKAQALVKAGDTVYIDAGVFSETVVIDTDQISLIGKDSNATVIDPPGSPTTPGLYGIYADTQTGLAIKNMCVTGAKYGIYFYNVDLSTITGDSASSNGSKGIYLSVNSDTNTVSNNTASSNPALAGIYLDMGSNNNTLSNNTASSNGTGIYIEYSSNNTVSNNWVSSNYDRGICLAANSNNTVSNNTANSNTNYGILLSTSSNNNTVSNNAASSNTQHGIYLESSSNNTVSNNTVSSNTTHGVFLSAASSNNTVTGNIVLSNLNSGIYMLSASNNNTVRNNLVRGGASTGIWIESSDTNQVIQNESTGNDTGIRILGSASNNIVSKNNIFANNANNVFNAAGLPQTLTRNWWGTTNEVSIIAKFSDTASAFSPYRLSMVDTTAGADTTAPAPPTGIAFDTTSVVGVVRVIWTAPTINEETNGGGVGFGGVKVYRLKNAVDTTHWANALVWTAGASDTNWTDTGVATGSTYYYRLTSRDAATRVNESFFTDTKISTVTPPGFTLSAPNGGQVWIVGGIQTIAWTTTGSIANVKLEYSTNSGETFSNVISASTANTGSYSWTIPDAIGNTVRVRLSNAIDSSVFDTSDADFTIRGAFTLTRPNGADSFQAATAENITWTTTGTISTVQLEYSSDSGSTWSVITPSTANTASYPWSVPNVSTTQAKVRVSNATDATTNDMSNDVFRIWPTVVPPPPDKILIVSGNHQLGRVLTTCTQQIKVQVVDTGGTAGVRYAKVTFLSASNSPQGAVTFGNGTLTTTTAYTDASGYVTETVVLGSTAGVYRIEARLDSTTPAKSALFTAYADGRQVPAGGGTAGLGWRMVGPNKAIPSAGWKLNSPSADGGLPNAINVYEYNNATSSYDAVTANAVRGRAYWVKDATGGRVFVPTEGVANDTPETVSIRLTPPSGGGWFQIASGQHFYTSWDSSVAFDTSPVNDTPLPQSLRMTPAQAAAAGVIQNKAYWYTGSNYIYGPAGETSSLTTMQLKPMVGFWLKVDKACTMFMYPNPVTPETYASEILQQAPSYQGAEGGAAQYLSATYKDMGKTGAEEDWGIQLIAKSGDIVDWQNYIGVKPSAGARQAANAFEAPGVAAGYLTLGVRQATAKGDATLDQTSNAWMAAQYAAQDKTSGGYAWDVKVATDLAGAATLSWDNAANLPGEYEAWLIGGPSGPVNMRKASSLVLPALSSGAQSSALTLAVGLSEFVAPFLAAPITKEFSFVYPNPGPDANGNMTFTYNLNGTGESKLLIFDVGGKLVRELRGSGTAGANNTITWDTTNKHGQKLGSGVYIYILESAGNKLVDKLAIVR